MKVGINGFGRIGRCVTRHIIDDRPDIEIVKINATGDIDTNMHLLKYDSVHGRWKGELDCEWSHSRDIQKLDWTGCDVVLECTGAFNDGEKAQAHINNGAKKVVISAPAKNVDRTVVYGVNHQDILPTDNIVSNASCTTNCLAPLVKVLNDRLKIINGQMTTIHSYTGDQGTVDRRHKDLYRARAGAMSMIPTSTGAAKALGLVIPEMQGKIQGGAIRVPTPNVSAVDLTVNVETQTDEKFVNSIVLNASLGDMEGIIKFSQERLVSVDFNTTVQSCIFASEQTRVVDKTMVRVLAWYDNEWSFSCRLADTAHQLINLGVLK
jgi:glyceraldehyde 3-phosphate dehydrogenase